VKVRDKIGIVGEEEEERNMLLIGYLVCYFIALMFLKIVFDWTKEDIGKIFKHGLIFLFLPLVFIGALVYDFVDKR
jgi:hypothetical protein